MPHRAITDIIATNGKEVADVAALSTAIGTYFAYLPEIAALLAIIWTLIRIGEWVSDKIIIIRGRRGKS